MSVHDLKCACGAVVRVREEHVGRVETCSACGQAFRSVWAKDPAGRKVLRRAGEVRIPPGCFEVRCRCGQTLVARRQQAGRRVHCPVCRESMTLEAAKDPQTLQTVIRRRPEETPPSPEAASSAPSPVRAGQDVRCPCGESLRVMEEHLGKEAMCPACGTLMRLERRRDPQTTRTGVRAIVVGRGEPPPRPPGPPPRPDWSLDDFA
jgi:uncharacterized protein (DUF983 family)